jgi:4'-phosphopantetheinyl transferase
MDLDVPLRELERLESWLDEGEKTRAARFRGDIHRHRFIASHGQMRALLGAYLGMAPAAIRFTPDALGKPRLAEAHPRAGGQARIEFSLSHSAGEGLLAITSGVAVGADVEVQHALRELDDLASRHFTAGELSDLRRLPPLRREDGFFAGWTRKEAYRRHWAPA